MSGSCAVRGRRFARPCRKNWPTSAGPSCSSEPHSSLPGPAALAPSVYDRGGASISDPGLSKRPSPEARRGREALADQPIQRAPAGDGGAAGPVSGGATLYCSQARGDELSCGSATAGQASCGARGWEGRCSMARPLPEMVRRPASTAATDVTPNATFLAISATIVALVLSACGPSSRSSTSSTAPATSATTANPVQRENSRLGTPGWEIPAGAGTVINGYASDTSVAPGQSFQLHVAAPPGSRYRVLVYRLGWYRGVGGRLIICVPGCRSSHAAIAQPPATTPGSVTGLFRAPWRVTDRGKIPPDAVSGYYEAKLEIVGGAYAGAVGSVPLIVRQSPAAPASSVLVQVPVNTWEAYNPWGGKSLYQFGTGRHAVEVSFDRPYDQRMFDNMVTNLELPWVRFLERNGIDVSYQTDVDTDEDPGSLPRHRLVFAIGHDEYWTQRMRDAFDRALALSRNLMFGSDSADWRMRYAAGRRTIVEWRDPSIDPVHNRRLDNGFFSTFGEPECQLMGVQHQWAAQRDLTAPPTSYRVVGRGGGVRASRAPGSDPWLAAAGMAPGDVIPGVVGYEWDSF